MLQKLTRYIPLHKAPKPRACHEKYLITKPSDKKEPQSLRRWKAMGQMGFRRFEEVFGCDLGVACHNNSLMVFRVSESIKEIYV